MSMVRNVKIKAGNEATAAFPVSRSEKLTSTYSGYPHVGQLNPEDMMYIFLISLLARQVWRVDWKSLACVQHTDDNCLQRWETCVVSC